MSSGMRWLSLIVAVAACGDDLDPDRCEPDGFADGEATVAGAPLGPFVRAAQVETSSPTIGITHALVFDERPGACGETTPTGRSLALLFCAPPTERRYIVVGRQAFRCPGDNVYALVERDGGIDVTDGSAGTIDIELAAGCVRGTYSVQLGSETLEGAFDAVVCP